MKFQLIFEVLYLFETYYLFWPGQYIQTPMNHTQKCFTKFSFVWLKATSIGDPMQIKLTIVVMICETNLVSTTSWQIEIISGLKTSSSSSRLSIALMMTIFLYLWVCLCLNSPILDPQIRLQTGHVREVPVGTGVVRRVCLFSRFAARCCVRCSSI